jgi:hypothetical protein
MLQALGGYCADMREKIRTTANKMAASDTAMQSTVGSLTSSILRLEAQVHGLRHKYKRLQSNKLSLCCFCKGCPIGSTILF